MFPARRGGGRRGFLHLKRPLDSGRHYFSSGRNRWLVRGEVFELASWATSTAAVVTVNLCISLALRYTQADADYQ
jgi:hypothetical protein